MQSIQVAKTKSEEKEMHAKQLLQQVKITIQNLTRELNSTKKQRDCLIARLDEVDSGKSILLIIHFIISYIV